MAQKHNKRHNKGNRNQNCQNDNFNQAQNQSQDESEDQNENQGQNQNQNNWYMNLNEHDKIELQLLEIGIAATYVDICSSLLGMLAARRSEEIILKRGMPKNQENADTNGDANQGQDQEQQQQQTDHPTPGQLVAFASCLGVFTILIYTRISLIRLEQVNEIIQEGNTKYTLTPNINITTSFMFSVIGSLLRTIGIIQRVNEDAEIIVVF